MIRLSKAAALAAALLAALLVFASCTGEASPDSPALGTGTGPSPSPSVSPTEAEPTPAPPGLQEPATTATAPLQESSTPTPTLRQGPATLAPAPTSTPTPILEPTPTPTEAATSPPATGLIRVTPPAVSPLPNVADIVEQVRPAVVSVLAKIVGRSMFGPRTGSSSGTGVIITSDGLVLTSNHVVEGASELTLTMDDGTQLEAEMVGADRLSDLAVLKLPPGEYPFLAVKNEFKPRVGEWVIAIGNALALPGGPTVTVGVVSALGRSRDTIGGTTLNDLIQTDTVINPGNSGGPLISMSGDMVGINTAVLRAGYGRTSPIEGIGFAIDMETVAEVSSQLIQLGRVRWAYMGVSLDDLSAETAARAGLPFRQGAVVIAVGPGTPAGEAGIQTGDIILSLDGRATGSVRELLIMLRQELEPGQRVEVELFRNGDEIQVEMVLGERPPG